MTLKKIEILVHFAIDNGWRKDDPTLRIKKFGEGEFHTWTDEEIATYERRWPVGTRERTAFAPPWGWAFVFAACLHRAPACCQTRRDGPITGLKVFSRSDARQAASWVQLRAPQKRGE